MEEQNNVYVIRDNFRSRCMFVSTSKAKVLKWFYDGMFEEQKVCYRKTNKDYGLPDEIDFTDPKQQNILISRIKVHFTFEKCPFVA